MSKCLCRSFNHHLLTVHFSRLRRLLQSARRRPQGFSAADSRFIQKVHSSALVHKQYGQLTRSRAALKHHPDRVPADSPERPKRTKKFQEVNDAYFTLSDPTRRREYDSARQFRQAGGDADDPDEQAPPGGFPWSSFGFGRGQKTEAEEEKFDNEQFGGVFEEMLREEGMAEGHQAAPTGKFWSMVGSLSGAAMGFIVANFPGAVAGGVAGNRLGAVRDTKGKSVYSVYQVCISLLVA